MERQKTGPEEIRDWQQILSRKHVQEPEVSITEGSLQLVNLKPGLVEAEHLQPHLLRGKNWSEREESRLVAELKKGLGRQVVDRELLGANLRDRTRLGEEQVELFIFRLGQTQHESSVGQSELGSHSHFLIGSKNVESQVTAGQLELCLRAQGLRLDRGVLNRCLDYHDDLDDVDDQGDHDDVDDQGGHEQPIPWIRVLLLSLHFWIYSGMARVYSLSITEYYSGILRYTLVCAQVYMCNFLRNLHLQLSASNSFKMKYLLQT